MTPADLTRSLELTAAAVARGINACADRLDHARSDLPAARARLATSVNAFLTHVKDEVTGVTGLLVGGLDLLAEIEAGCWPAEPELPVPLLDVLQQPDSAPGDMSAACMPVCPDCGSAHDPFTACIVRKLNQAGANGLDEPDGPPAAPVVPSDLETAALAGLDPEDAATLTLAREQSDRLMAEIEQRRQVLAEAEKQQVEEVVAQAANPPVARPARTADHYNRLNKAALKVECQRRKLPAAGNRAELIARLQTHDEANPGSRPEKGG